jgi:hypothetical protein
LLLLTLSVPVGKVLLSLKRVEQLNGGVELGNGITVGEFGNVIVLVRGSDSTMVAEGVGIMTAKQTIAIL